MDEANSSGPIWSTFEALAVQRVSETVMEKVGPIY